MENAIFRSFGVARAVRFLVTLFPTLIRVLRRGRRAPRYEFFSVSATSLFEGARQSAQHRAMLPGHDLKREQSCSSSSSPESLRVFSRPSLLRAKPRRSRFRTFASKVSSVRNPARSSRICRSASGTTSRPRRARGPFTPFISRGSSATFRFPKTGTFSSSRSWSARPSPRSKRTASRRSTRTPLKRVCATSAWPKGVSSTRRPWSVPIRNCAVSTSRAATMASP